MVDKGEIVSVVRVSRRGHVLIISKDSEDAPYRSGDDAGTLDGAPVPTMSLAGMLAMKEQYPRLGNRRPW